MTPAAEPGPSYAGVLAAGGNSSVVSHRLTREDRQEAKFWECRRSLRLWPVPDPTIAGVKDFLKEKLNMEDSFLEEDLGGVQVKKCLEKKAKNKHEVVVTFEEKQVRDAVKAQGPNLASYREEAGMRLQIPDHLQKDFQALMSVAFDLKKKNPELKRNVKFDEESLGLFMDFQSKKEGQWRRMRPEQAKKALKSRPEKTSEMEVEDDEILSLLGDAGE